MLYNQIVNPKTGRKVNIKGKLGRQILSNYINYLNGGSSNCANFHSDPIKCQSSRDESGNYCVYSAAKYKGEVGQCRKSSAKDIEKSKESARRRKTLEKKFQQSAALRLQKRYRSKKRVDRFADAAGDMLSKEQTRKSQEKAAKIAEEIRIANLKEEAKKVAKKKKCKLRSFARNRNLGLDCGSCSYRYDDIMEEDACMSDSDVINDEQCAVYCELDNMVQEEPTKLEVVKKRPKKKKCKLNKMGRNRNLNLDCGSCSYRYDDDMEEDSCLSDSDVINDNQCRMYCELDNMVPEEPSKSTNKVVKKELPNCKTLRKGKCRETKGCMLTKGKKKSCVPCDLKKYNTKDQCLYR